MKIQLMTLHFEYALGAKPSRLHLLFEVNLEQNPQE
jgi:hypothetical protein